VVLVDRREEERPDRLSGLRLGTTAVSQRGMGAAEMLEIAEQIDALLLATGSNGEFHNADAIRGRRKALAARFAPERAPAIARWRNGPRTRSVNAVRSVLALERPESRIGHVDRPSMRRLRRPMHIECAGQGLHGAEGNGSATALNP
jgi:hypothetical protein